MQPEQIRVSRGGDEGPPASSVRPPKPHSIPWRNVVLIAAPFLLSIGNLVEARFEKQRAVATGDNEYARLKGVGEKAKSIAIDEGKNVGKTKYLGLVTAARNKQTEILVAYQKEAESRRAQGLAKSALPQNQANIQRALFAPLRRIYQISLDRARIAAERDHGILVRINDGDPNPPEGKYPVTKIEYLGQRKPVPERIRELAQEVAKLDKELPAIAATLREGPAELARERTFGARPPCEREFPKF